MAVVDTSASRPGTAARRLFDLLGELGASPELRDEGRFVTVLFTHEGLRYRALLDAEDEDFLELRLGFVLREPPAELTVRRVAQAVQDHFKVVKASWHPEPGSLDLVLDLFLGGHAVSAALLRRCLRGLREASEHFFDHLPSRLPEARA